LAGFVPASQLMEHRHAYLALYGPALIRIKSFARKSAKIILAKRMSDEVASDVTDAKAYALCSEAAKNIQ
jgi:hypothetical protein